VLDLAHDDGRQAAAACYPWLLRQQTCPGSQFASVTLTAAAEGIKVLQDD